MSENTKIEWADHSWSPWRGCTKVSEGCAHCYAETLSKRNPSVLGEWGKGKPRVVNQNWRKPIGWNLGPRICPKCGTKSASDRCGVCSQETTMRRVRVFPSLCDWLDDDGVTLETLGEFLHLIHETPNMDWLLLTKRPELWRTRLGDLGELNEHYAGHARRWLDGKPPANVWFGVSVENQRRADERIPILNTIPARIRWLSLEPLLGPIAFQASHLYRIDGLKATGAMRTNPETGKRQIAINCPKGKGDQIQWAVIGGESGAGARPCDVKWIREIKSRLQFAGVPVFVKQLGAVPADRNDRGFEGDSGPQGWPMGTDVVDDMEPGEFQGKRVRVRLRHKKGGDPSEWPEDLRVREFPEVKP